MSSYIVELSATYLGFSFAKLLHNFCETERKNVLPSLKLFAQNFAILRNSVLCTSSILQCSYN